MVLSKNKRLMKNHWIFWVKIKRKRMILHIDIKIN